MANRANTPMQIPLVHSEKSPAGAFMANILIQGVAAGFHAIQVEESNWARAALQHMEHVQRAVHEMRATVSGNEERRRRGTYEQHKAMFEDEELKRKIELENEKAVVSHGVSMVGRPRVPPDLVAVGTAKIEEGGVADMAIVFLPDGPCVAKPVPYFDDFVDALEAERKARLLPVVYRDPQLELEETIHAHPGLTVGDIHPYTGKPRRMAQGSPAPPGLTLPDIRARLAELTKNFAVERFYFYHYYFENQCEAYACYGSLYACRIDGIWYSSEGAPCGEPVMPGACRIPLEFGVSEGEGARLNSTYPMDGWRWQKKRVLMARIKWFADAMEIVIRAFNEHRNPFKAMDDEFWKLTRYYRQMTDESYPLRVRFYHWDRPLSNPDEQMRDVWEYRDQWARWDA